MHGHLPNDDTRVDNVLATMAVGFLALSAFFFGTATLDLMDGEVHTKVGSVFHSESPERYWQMVRTSYGFGAATTAVAALCAIGARLLKPKS